jgi:SMODS and SLOG-associating 2TM effector domain family 4
MIRVPIETLPDENAAPPATELKRKLRELEVSTHALEGAHAIEASRWERWTRDLSWAGIILSTIVSASIFTSLATNADKWAKVAVGIVSLLVAVVTAFNQKNLFKGQADGHTAASRAYADLYSQAGHIPVQFENDEISRDQAEKKLIELEAKREELERKPPMASRAAYQDAFMWARNVEEL